MYLSDDLTPDELNEANAELRTQRAYAADNDNPYRTHTRGEVS